MSLNATLDFAELKGIMKGKVEVATKMLKDNKPIEEIIKYSELPKSEIEELRDRIITK